MKRLVFKKWVNWLLIGVAFISIMAMVGECENGTTFIVSKGIALVTFYVSYKLLSKFGRHEAL